MCERCDACSKGCPSKAIPLGPPTTARHNRSNLVGVEKWTIDGEKCFSFWTKVNSDCSVCVRVCPYTRDYTRRVNRAWLRLARRLPALALRIDARQGRGRRRQSDDWWPGG